MQAVTLLHPPPPWAPHPAFKTFNEPVPRPIPAHVPSLQPYSSPPRCCSLEVECMRRLRLTIPLREPCTTFTMRVVKPARRFFVTGKHKSFSKMTNSSSKCMCSVQEKCHLAFSYQNNYKISSGKVGRVTKLLG